mmetsp:Transcript_56608/g.165535  ORF Transcript_56608/g.165535 Transcript_56608/m.165535 type:complete len:629 (+) Transcript_56608:123-2009(+)
MISWSTASVNAFRMIRGCFLLLGLACAKPLLLYDLSNYSFVGHSLGDACRVLHAPAGSGKFPLTAEQVAQFDVVITDDRAVVPFMGTAGKFYFLEEREYPLREAGRQIAEEKERLPLDLRRQGMSVFLPPKLDSQEIVQIMEDGMVLMPANLFVDEGTFESRRRAFANFTFTVMLNEEGGTPPQSVVDCIAHGTVPIFVGKHHMMNYTRFFPFGVVKFASFAVEFAIQFMLQAPADAFYVYTNSVKMVQEFFHMRYRAPFPERLRRHSAMACHRLTSPTPALALVTIYSARANFGRRMALRDTWLPLLRRESPRVLYKFFVADTLLGEQSEIDQLLRQERDMFDDMVFLSRTTDEYPIGKKGLAVLLWVAHHTDAQFWLKLDDDLYLRPRPLLDRLQHMQRAEAYWGAFDYSGRVVRDATDPHFTAVSTWAEEVFPPYARGAALAMSLDLVRQIAREEEREPFKKIIVEDVSYGFYLWQLAFDRNGASVTMLDNDEAHFAMDAKCCTEASHPNDCWLPLSGETWIVHHATPKMLQCMFAKDVAAGLYQAGPPVSHAGLEGMLGRMAAHDSTILSTADGARHGIVPSQRWAGPLPNLCDCVVTPPAHPGRPLQKGGLQELSTGPRLFAQ